MQRPQHGAQAGTVAFVRFGDALQGCGGAGTVCLCGFLPGCGQELFRGGCFPGNEQAQHFLRRLRQSGKGRRICLEAGGQQLLQEGGLLRFLTGYEGQQAGDDVQILCGHVRGRLPAELLLYPAGCEGGAQGGHVVWRHLSG